jgi:hypothetical protein
MIGDPSVSETVQNKDHVGAIEIGRIVDNHGFTRIQGKMTVQGLVEIVL